MMIDYSEKSKQVDVCILASKFSWQFYKALLYSSIKTICSKSISCFSHWIKVGWS